MNHVFSQAELVDQLKAGDEKAYRILYDQYYKMLCILAYQYVKDRFLAESLVGDVMFSIWEHRDSLQIHTSLNAYLVKAVKNLCINHLNHIKVKRQSESILIWQKDRQQQEYDLDVDYPLAKLIVLELEKSLEKAIDALPAERREVFRLSRMEELSYLEIAEKLDISVNTVKYHIKNALTQLREHFKDYLLLVVLLFLQ